jgi:hypothetical protein
MASEKKGLLESRFPCLVNQLACYGFRGLFFRSRSERSPSTITLTPIDRNAKYSHWLVGANKFLRGGSKIDITRKTATIRPTTTNAVVKSRTCIN